MKTETRLVRYAKKPRALTDHPLQVPRPSYRRLRDVQGWHWSPQVHTRLHDAMGRSCLLDVVLRVPFLRPRGERRKGKGAAEIAQRWGGEGWAWHTPSTAPPTAGTSPTRGGTVRTECRRSAAGTRKSDRGQKTTLELWDWGQLSSNSAPRTWRKSSSKP